MWMLISTGAAGIQHNSSNLDTLLHPQQSTRRPQMVIRLDGRRVNNKCARSVIEHVRGRVVCTNIATFVKGATEVMAPFTHQDIRCLELVSQAALPIDTFGFVFHLNVESMVWHQAKLLDITSAMNGIQDGLLAVPVWVGGEPCVLVTSQLLIKLCAMAGTFHWYRPLPVLSELLREMWPCVADVFCAPRDWIA